MTIILDRENSRTVCICDNCGFTDATDVPTGAAVDGWITGRLTLDVSLSEQVSIPICFCHDCSEGIVSTNRILVVPSPVIIDEPVTEEPDVPGIIDDPVADVPDVIREGEP